MISKFKYYLFKRQYTLDELIQFLLSFALVVVPVFFIPNRSLPDPYSQPRLIFLGTIASALLIIFLIKPKIIIEIFNRNRIINGLVLIYMLIQTYSLTYSIDLELSLFGIHVWKDGYIVQLIYFTFFFAGQSSFRFSNRLLKWILVSGTIIGLYGILQSFGIDFMVESNFTGLPVTAGMYNQNFLASYLVLILPISIYLFMNEYKVWNLISYFILLYTLLGTMTRGAWLGYIASVLVFLLLLRKRSNRIDLFKKKIIVLSLATLLTIVLYSLLNDYSIIQRFLSIFIDTGDLLSGEKVEFVGSYRGYIWRETIKYILKKPFQGYGIQNVMLLFLMKHNEEMFKLFGLVILVNNVHNEYLQIAISTGIPSLIIIGIANTMILVSGFKRVTTECIYVPVLAGVIGYLVQYFFSLSFITNTFILYIMLGSILNNINNDNMC